MTGFMLANGFQGKRRGILRGILDRVSCGLCRDAQKANGFIALQVFRCDDIGSVHTGDPDVLCRLFTASREAVGQSTDHSSTDCEGQFEREIDDGGEGRSGN